MGITHFSFTVSDTEALLEELGDFRERSSCVRVGMLR
jgi:hypothetical protein